MTRRKGKSSGLLRRALLACILLLCGFVAFEALTWPDVGALSREAPRTTAFVEAYRGRTRGAKVDLTFVPYARIASSVKRAVLVAEDINFFSHHGFEIGEMRNAVEEAVEENEGPRGASTITQQLAKNLWLSPSRSPWRKAKEAILTWQLERTLDKRRILELYLNVVELGDGVYGVGPAARRYFGKAPSDLDDREAAQLAASLPRPRSWHPGSGSRAYARYVDRILKRMERATFLERLVGGGSFPSETRLGASRKGSGPVEEQHMSPHRRFAVTAVLAAAALGLLATTACVPESASVSVAVTTAPPAARVEVIGTSPGPDYVWIGGHWGWHGTQYVWVDGRWDRGPHAKAKWVPGHWKQTKKGWVWTEGHWK